MFVARPVGKRTRRGLSGLAAVVVAVLAAPALPAQAAPPRLAERLASAVTVEGINRHLIALQRIADRNGGEREDATPGFQESLDYVAGRVAAAGFDVSIQEFPYDRVVIDAATVTAGAVRITPNLTHGSPNTQAGGATGPLVVAAVDSTPGCEASDYAGLNPTAAVALIRRGGCTFTQKQQVAAEAGAVAALIYNNVPGPLPDTSVDPTLARIPTATIAGTDGATLSARAGDRVTLDIRSHIETTTGRNVIAQTRTGRTDNVVTLGAHLASLNGTPGMNENASSVAALLEVALRLGSTPRVNNAVRFGWWGADWRNTGSAAYLQSLDFESQLDIALYLDFHMIASPNGGHFVYDGDNSEGFGPRPYGSAQIERAFVDYLATRGTQTEGTNFSAPGDYTNFIASGIPTGGLYAGAHLAKTEPQAAKWGGTAGTPFDPCNLAACDNLGNLNRPLLDRNSDAIAYITATYATSTEDINGVPPRSQRAQTRAAHPTATTTAAHIDPEIVSY